MYCNIRIILVLAIFAITKPCLSDYYAREMSHQDTFNLHNLSQENISNYVKIFVDTNNTHFISEVVFKEEDKFIKNLAHEIIIDFSKSNHWLKFSIKNNYNYLISAILEIKNPSINKIQLFVEKYNFVRALQETGDSYPFYTRNTDNRNFIFEITLDPSSVYTYYLKINTEGSSIKFPVMIYSPAGFTKKISREHIVNGVFYGIMLAIIFTSLFLLLLNFRKPAHFYYLIYVTLTGFFVLDLDGLSFQFLWPNSPWLANNMSSILALSGTFFLIQFTIAYFNLRNQNNIYYLLTNGLAILNLLFIPVSLIDTLPVKFISCGIAYLMIISIVSITVIAIILFKKGPQLTIFFILAFLSFLFSTIIISSNIFSHVINITERENAFKIGLAIQVILLSVALSIRLKILQEKAHKISVDNLKKLNDFKEDANKRLEGKVRERTDSLSKSNEKFLSAVIEIGNKNTKLHQQRIEILKHRDEITEKNLVLEKSFSEIKKKNKELAQRNSEIKAKQEQIIEQKNLLEIKNQDITDSINYAKRIQTSILPGSEYINQIIPNNFILFRPKDILSGDFYWIDKYPPEKNELILNSKKKRKIIIASVDCTGHGIPGAIMSVIGKDQLDRAIFQYGLTKPSAILEAINQGVTKVMSYHSAIMTVKDGMDISLICFNPDKYSLEFAGANQQIYHIRNNELTIYSGDRKSIGETIHENKFHNHKIEIKKDDMVYLFSDGYVDQFGGPNNKKFKYKQFKDLLLNVHLKPISEQENLLLEAHLKWKSTCEQVDDILIIGIKF